MMTIGTKLKYSSTGLDSWNFFNSTNGITRDNQVTIVQPMMVNNTKLKEGMFDNHSHRTSN